ncbi:uncharacterized protein LOC131857634 [Cryptomeria japonica]|uniref:uncharacterized protein LOC131857634 n=1 Tax=Cryptomeria japonica TaxID=3369 RepID=UPI0027DA6739|nr:uncharacterized protein LOC131857634 [Cryptomeria japonica]
MAFGGYNKSPSREDGSSSGDKFETMEENPFYTLNAKDNNGSHDETLTVEEQEERQWDAIILKMDDLTGDESKMAKALRRQPNCRRWRDVNRDQSEKRQRNSQNNERGNVNGGNDGNWNNNNRGNNINNNRGGNGYGSNQNNGNNRGSNGNHRNGNGGNRNNNNGNGGNNGNNNVGGDNGNNGNNGDGSDGGFNRGNVNNQNNNQEENHNEDCEPTINVLSSDPYWGRDEDSSEGEHFSDVQQRRENQHYSIHQVFSDDDDEDIPALRRLFQNDIVPLLKNLTEEEKKAFTIAVVEQVKINYQLRNRNDE